MPRLALALVPLVLLVGVAAEWVAHGPDTPHLGDDDPTWIWVADLATGWMMAAAGFLAWAKVPASRVGPLLVLTGTTWFVGNFGESTIPEVAWLAARLSLLYTAPLIHLLVTYPGGRAGTPVELIGVAIGYGAILVEPIWDDPTTAILLAGLVAAITARGRAVGKGALRKQRLLAAQVSAVLAGLVIIDAVLRAASPEASSEASAGTAELVLEVALSAAAIVLSLGLAWRRRPHADLTDVVVELTHGGSTTVRDALARILGDASLEAGYWVPGRRAYLTATGSTLDPPPPGSSRAVTPVARDGQPVAILVHDRALLDEPGLVDAISTATRLGASNDRLQGEVRAQLGELQASRRRLLVAGDEARRRLEARLHSGAQRQVGSLIATLATARVAVGPDPTNAATSAALERAERQAERALDDFRVLSRGLHPRDLTDLGFVGALEALAGQSAVPVRVEVSADAVVPAAQADAWFICSEALTNVAHHSRATSASMTVRVIDGTMTIEVTDDGIGGVDMASGSGLRGLADRAEAVGGSLRVESSPGSGTRLFATIPATRTGWPDRAAAAVASTNDPGRNTPARTDGAGAVPAYGGSIHPPQGERR